VNDPEAWLARLSTALDSSGLTLLAVGGVLGLCLGMALGAGLGAFVVSRMRAQLGGRLRDTFHALSSEALDRSSDRFLALAGERLGALERSNVEALSRREEAVDALVRPIRESLSRVDEKLQRVETERQGHHAALTKHLELVATANRNLERQTQNLAQALRSPNARGRWGELQLRRVVELAGMLEHCDFHEQSTLSGRSNGQGAGPDSASNGTVPVGRLPDSDGASRPDLIVRMPGGRVIAVDAKAPLQAYLAASEATDEASRKHHLARHAKHVRRHLDGLGSRAYWSKLSGSPEFVILFLPGEPFFAEALAQDPELIERGVERKVLMAGPTTLIALLRAVAHGWQQEAMAQNASSICDLGRELFDRVVTLNQHFESLGKKLDGAVGAYNTAMGSLESRVHVTARRMAEFGIAESEKLGSPPRLDRPVRLPGTGARTETGSADPEPEPNPG
jgi:DNA recombination protein RmuC